MTLFAGIDIGTSGARCLVVDEQGRRVALGERAWRYERDSLAAAELDPRAAVTAVFDAVREAVHACDPEDVMAIGVTSQRSGVVLVDEEGVELYVGPNADGRAFVEGLALERAHGEVIYRTAGRLPAMLYLPARLAWFKANDPERYARVRGALSLGDWIVLRLTGASATEQTQAAEMLVYDLAAGAWSDDLCARLDVDPSLLPRIAPTGTPVGGLTAQAARATGLRQGTLVVPAGGDTHTAAVALGVCAPRDAHVAAGTTLIVQQVRGDAAIDPDGRLWTSPHAIDGGFVHEAHCGEAGAALVWLGETFEAAPGRLAEIADASPAGCGGVSFFDTWPSTVADFPLVRHGGFSFPVPLLALGRGRGDLARAVFEGIAFGARAGIEWVESSNGEATTVAVSGGCARSTAFRVALAGALERPIVVASDEASSARGAAIVAASQHHGGVRGAVDAMRDGVVEVAPLEAHGYPAIYAAWRERAAAIDAGAMRMSGLM